VGALELLDIRLYEPNSTLNIEPWTWNQTAPGRRTMGGTGIRKTKTQKEKTLIYQCYTTFSGFIIKSVYIIFSW